MDQWQRKIRRVDSPRHRERKHNPTARRGSPLHAVISIHTPGTLMQAQRPTGFGMHGDTQFARGNECEKFLVVAVKKGAIHQWLQSGEGAVRADQ